MLSVSANRLSSPSYLARRSKDLLAGCWLPAAHILALRAAAFSISRGSPKDINKSASVSCRRIANDSTQGSSGAQLARGRRLSGGGFGWQDVINPAIGNARHVFSHFLGDRRRRRRRRGAIRVQTKP